MIVTVANLFNDSRENIRGKVIGLYVPLFIFNAAVPALGPSPRNER